jgi:hypothetical protein
MGETARLKASSRRSGLSLSKRIFSRGLVPGQMRRAISQSLRFLLLRRGSKALVRPVRLRFFKRFGMN